MSGGADAILDLDRPPFEPPDGCIDPDIWVLARQVFARHDKTPTGECVSCPRWKTCPGNALARDGLATAMGRKVKDSAYWINYSAIVAVHEKRDGHAHR